jgi:hypothetical protein
MISAADAYAKKKFFFFFLQRLTVCVVRKINTGFLSGGRKRMISL